MRAFLLEKPDVEVTEEELKEIGVLHWVIDVDNLERDGKLDSLCKERGYSYKDVVHVTPEHLPNYAEKIKSFFQEHLHTDDEIRLFLEGSGYFDVRNKNDEWVRLHCFKGDMISLPAGIYHRYTNDEKNMAKVMRFFAGTPVWTPYSRSPETDRMEQRKKYLDSIKNKGNRVQEIFVPTPAQFDEVLKAQLKQLETNSERELFVLVSADWCPDCQKASLLLKQKFANLSVPATVLKCDVARNEYKGNPHYPYRTHPLLKITTIPTLIHWGKQGPKERLVEAQCYDSALVNDFFEPFIH
jgi:1,2-dihydroxy-3-keto-5-methylthiopentene dioxygenase